MPRIEPERKMFSLPLSSGWNPVPTSSSEPTRPASSARPSVGSVIRERTFSSVDLPAPLRPTMPTTSPASIRSDVLQCPEPFRSSRGCPRRRSRGSDAAGDRLGETAVGSRWWTIRYRLPSPSAGMAGLAHQMTSAKVRSARRKYGSPVDEHDRADGQGMSTAPIGAWPLGSRSAQRKPSTTPAIGFRR